MKRADEMHCNKIVQLEESTISPFLFNRHGIFFSSTNNIIGINTDNSLLQIPYGYNPLYLAYHGYGHNPSPSNLSPPAIIEGFLYYGETFQSFNKPKTTEITKTSLSNSIVHKYTVEGIRGEKLLAVGSNLFLIGSTINNEQLIMAFDNNVNMLWQKNLGKIIQSIAFDFLDTLICACCKNGQNYLIQIFSDGKIVEIAKIPTAPSGLVPNIGFLFDSQDCLYLYCKLNPYYLLIFELPPSGILKVTRTLKITSDDGVLIRLNCTIDSLGKYIVYGKLTATANGMRSTLLKAPINNIQLETILFDSKVQSPTAPILSDLPICVTSEGSIVSFWSTPHSDKVRILINDTWDSCPLKNIIYCTTKDDTIYMVTKEAHKLSVYSLHI